MLQTCRPFGIHLSAIGFQKTDGRPKDRDSIPIEERPSTRPGLGSNRYDIIWIRNENLGKREKSGKIQTTPRKKFWTCEVDNG